MDAGTKSRHQFNAQRLINFLISLRKLKGLFTFTYDKIVPVRNPKHFSKIKFLELISELSEAKKIPGLYTKTKQNRQN